MKADHLRHLVCPKCKGDLRLHSDQDADLSEIETGMLYCIDCHREYPVINHIPRFVSLENYTDSFGFEWLKHAKTQYDSHTHTKISEERFFNETHWAKDLSGQIILEAGSGSGRFTEIAAWTGALVISVDYSVAVEANYASNGSKPNVLIAQADLYHLPFKENYFDKILCIGVLQHTPDVERTFFTLPKYLKSKGNLVIDVYRKHKGLAFLFQTRYFIRPFVCRMSSERLYRFCQGYINGIWGIASLIHKIPKIGTRLNWILLVPDYRNLAPLSEEMLKDWAILDAFDILSPVYDNPQYLETVQEWFLRAGFEDIEVKYGYNGIEGKGVKR
jgi:uncharacterized protein YbaR (Trm112 family)/ubiquinone/menaquinone biosynthesis C-methylase UbiE